MIGEIWYLLVLGFVLGFFTCMLLWFWVEKKNAEERNEEEEQEEVSCGTKKFSRVSEEEEIKAKLKKIAAEGKEE